MLIDFHTHTTASDGALSPSALLERARERGVQVLAITDHDTLRGFHEASTLVPPDVRLVSGVEISCMWSGVPIHVVGLNLDANDPARVSVATQLELRPNDIVFAATKPIYEAGTFLSLINPFRALLTGLTAQ